MLLLNMAGAGEHCMAASCALCVIKSKTQDKSDGLELAGVGKKKNHLVQHSKHFLICCANENMYMDKQFCVSDDSYSEKGLLGPPSRHSTAAQSCITFSILEVHVTSQRHTP